MCVSEFGYHALNPTTQRKDHNPSQRGSDTEPQHTAQGSTTRLPETKLLIEAEDPLDTQQYTDLHQDHLGRVAFLRIYC